MVAFLRKHAFAVAALAVYNLVFFFPVIFMGRVVSPNDVYFNFEPWAGVRPASMPHVQNSLFNDPPTAYLTLMSLLKEGGGAFHWNPYVGSGIPGYGSSAAAVLSPMIMLAVMAVPLMWVYTAIIFLKLNVAFVFAYLWLREERLGKVGAAVGAIVIAGAGIYSVRWLWQITNATVFYPALLWLVRRAFNGRRSSIALTALIAFAYALSGFPSAMAYGAYLTVAYAIFLGVRLRMLPMRAIAASAAGVALALMAAAPSIVPFIQLVRRTGYLGMRQTTSLTTFYPASHWASFIHPDRLGSHAYRSWSGDPALGMLNNYFEATVYLGLLTLPLALFGLLHRRAPARWFWLVAAALILGCMFGAPLVSAIIAALPGFKYTTLARVSLLLPLAAGYLAAAGAGRLAGWIRPRMLRRVGAAVIVVLLAYELAAFAGRFHPYLLPSQARVPTTPTIDFLQRERGPFRIAPFFDYLWPNTAELFRVEDIRSHFGSEAIYRRMLLRVDPAAWSGTSTVLQFNSLGFNFDDPFLSMLGVRWLPEHRSIDIIRWKIFERTEPGVAEAGPLAFRTGDRFSRSIVVDANCWAIEVPVTIESVRGPSARFVLTLEKNGVSLWRRAFTPADAAVMNKLYVPLRPHARAGDTVTLHLEAAGVAGYAGKGADGGFYFGRVRIPVIFDRELPDGRLYRHVGELPRFQAVQQVRKLNHDELLAARDLDFERVAVITDDAVMPPDVGSAGDAQVVLDRYQPAVQTLTTRSSAPFFLSSSEKLTPELAVTIDGKRIRPIEINGLFAGLPVPAGTHEIVFSRRIGRGWWPWSAAAVIAWALIALRELFLARRRPALRSVS